MNDFSFIRLEPTLEKALDTRINRNAEILYYNQIQLSPSESYRQITNVKDGISFGGNYQVFLCYSSGDEILEITSKIDISEFTDANGKKQIKLVINPIEEDFYNTEVIFKLKHTVSDAVWYSNIVTITNNNIHKTTLFQYKAFDRFNNIDYNQLTVNEYLSIRLNCYFYGASEEVKTDVYTDNSGYLRSSKAIVTNYDKYIFNAINDFTFVRLNNLLKHPVVYADGFRVTNKETLKDAEKFGSTNVFKSEFKLAINYNEKINEDTPVITINDVSLNYLTAKYDVTFENTGVLTNWRYQIKSGGVWGSENTILTPTSPLSLTITQTQPFYIRLVAKDSNGNNVYSNEYLYQTNSKISLNSLSVVGGCVTFNFTKQSGYNPPAITFNSRKNGGVIIPNTGSATSPRTVCGLTAGNYIMWLSEVETGVKSNILSFTIT